MDEINLLDLDEASQHLDHKQNLLIDLDSNAFDCALINSHTKAASWSEPPSHFDIFSLEDLIKDKKNSLQRPTRSQSLYEPSSHTQRLLRRQISNRTAHKLDFKSLRASKPLMIPNSPSLLSSLDRDKSLNGYIKHETRASWRDTSSSTSTQKLIDLKNDQESQSDEEDDEDEVFHMSRAKEELNFRKPLISSSKSAVGKKVRFHKESEEAEIVSCDDFSEPNLSIRGGKSWRERVFYFSLFLLANLILGLVVIIIVYISRDVQKGPIFNKKVAIPILSPCDSIKSVYVANFTSEHSGVYSNGPVRIIESLKFGVYLLIVPYGSFCVHSNSDDVVCESGGVMALNPDSLQLVWSYAPQGQMVSLVCGADINRDGTQDCALTTVQPVTLHVVSGVRGRRLLPEWIPEGAKRIHPVQWVSDIDSDRKPELLITLETLDGDVDIVIMMSKDWNDPHKSKRLLISVRETTATDSAKIWRSGDGSLMVLATFQEPLDKGVYMWSFWDLYFKNFEKKQILAANATPTAPVGVFANLKRGGDTQLVLCSREGNVLATNRDVQIWNFQSDSGACISDSLGFAYWLKGVHRPQVVSRIKLTNSEETQTIILNGTSGELISSVDTSPGVFYDSPLTLAMKANAGDWVIYWRRRQHQNQLVASDSRSTISTIVIDDRIILERSADEEAKESAALINRRYTPSFFVRNSTATLLYATSAPIHGQWRLLVHKLNVSCVCNRTSTCTALSDHQSWNAYRGINSDGYFFA